MSKNESRRNRINQEDQSNRSTSKGGISKVYYIVIGILFLVLIGLIIFIFSRSGNDVKLNEDDTAEQVEETTDSELADENNSEVDENTSEDVNSTEEETSNEQPNTEEQDDNTDTEESVEENELNEGDSEVVSEDAPHDSDHTTDFTNGSSDRVAIKNQVIQATGLDSNLIEWWIGNDGPGKVKATVSDAARTEYYDVFLQYGDGTWHVTSYQRVSGN